MTQQPEQPKKRSILDIAKERKAQRPTPPPASNAPAKPEPKRGTPTIIGHEAVKALCGHDVQMDLYPDKKDLYRKQRRENIGKKDCPTCRQARHQKEFEDAVARRQQKRAAHGRLPHGSKFEASYDAERVLWTGAMILLIQGEGCVTVVRFDAEAKAIISLLSRLDKLYREWKKQRKVENAVKLAPPGPEGETVEGSAPAPESPVPNVLGGLEGGTAGAE